MRVLVYCPLAPHPPRLFAKTLKALFEVDWPEPYELLYGVSKDAEDVNADIAGKLERARQVALKGDFDALLAVSYDVVVLPDTLLRLADVDASVVCGVTVDREPPHNWKMDADSGCVLYRRAALLSADWLQMPAQCVEDMYCSRLSMVDGGQVLTPDPVLPERVHIHYLVPARAPATVPYSRTILAREPA